MRKTYSLSICVCSLGVFLYSSSALSFPHRTNLINQIKPNLIAKSKPASYFTKLAAVHFVKDNSLPKFGSGGHDIKNDPKSCPTGTTWYGGSCQKNCDTNTYPYTDEPDKKKGKIVYEVCQGNIRFGYSSCNGGWLLNGGKCDVNPCTGYVYSSRPDSNAGTIDQCKSGEGMKYKYTSCNSGWNLSNGKCVTSTCDASVYPYSSNPGSEAGTVINCKTGTSYKYGYSSCNTGWDKSNGYCNIHVCDTNTYPYTTNPGSTAGTVITCQTGSTTKYGYSACNSGWTKSGGSCNENACTGYPSTSQTITGCKTTENCKKGTSTVYKCVVCNSGYNLTGGKCEASCDLSQYPYTSSPDSEAGTVISCTSGTTTKYAYSSCNEGWTLSGGYCNENACTEYNSTSSSISNCASTASCKKGTAYVYKCMRCNIRSYRYFDGTCVLGDRPIIYSGSTVIGVAVSSNLAVAMRNEAYMSWYDAVDACKAKTTGGKSWRLPTKDELLAMSGTYKATYATLELNGGSGIVSSYYWSSTESLSTNAWGVNPSGGYASGGTKTSNAYVRCVFDL